MEERTKWVEKRVIRMIVFGVLFYLVLSNGGSLVSSFRWLANLFAPLWIGLVLAMILNVPMTAIEKRISFPVRKQKRKKGRRLFAILLTFFLGTGIVTGILLLVVPEVAEALEIIKNLFLEEKGVLEQKIRKETGPWKEALALLPLNVSEIQETVEIWVNKQSSNITEQLIHRVRGTAGGILNATFGVVFAVYILVSKERLKQQVGRLLSVWLSHDAAQKVSHGLFLCFRTFRNFMIGQSLEAVILGTLCGIGMFLLRIPYAGTVGALVGVTALIPILGAFVGAAVGILLILTVSPFKTVIFLIFLLLLQQVEGNIIYPKVVGAKINLPAIWVLAAVVVGGNIAGPVGMFLGVPVVSSVYAWLKEATCMRELQKAAGE